MYAASVAPPHYHLERALAVPDLDAMRVELVAAWTVAPQERLSRLVECVDAQRTAVALPPALASLSTQTAANAHTVLRRIAVDPCVAPALLDLLAKPPWRANPSLPFWRACCARIVFTRDPRILEKLEHVALGYPKTIPTTVGEKVAGYLNKAALQLRAAIDAIDKLDARTDAACTELERRLGAKPPAPRTLGTQIVDTLLAAVYEAPHDDAPRLVLADHLVQRGDPRGELINLQLARAAGRADDTPRARELELLAASNGQWVGRIGLAIDVERFVFHRGFVAYGQLPRTRGTLAQFVSDPAWATLEILDVNWTTLLRDERAALGQLIAGRGVRAVIGVQDVFLSTLHDDVLAKLERIEQLGDGGATQFAANWLRHAARPRSFGYARAIEDVADIAHLLEAPGFARLEQLVLHTQQPQRFIGVLEATGLPRLSIVMSSLRVDIAREGKRFARATVRHPRGQRGGFPEAVMRHIVKTLGDRDVVVDARTPFYPGMTVGHAVTKNWKTIDGVVDHLDLVGR